MDQFQEKLLVRGFHAPFKQASHVQGTHLKIVEAVAVKPMTLYYQSPISLQACISLTTKVLPMSRTYGHSEPKCFDKL
jgi:predicted transcriptional regulator